MTPVSLERLHILLQDSRGPVVVTENEARLPDVEVAGDFERQVSQRFGDDLSALGARQGFARLADLPEVGAHIDRHPAEAPLVTQLVREPLGVTEKSEGALQLADGVERISEIEAQVDRLLQDLGRLPQMLQRR